MRQHIFNLFLSGNNLPIISITLLTIAYQQAFLECKDNGNNRIKNNTMSYCRNKHVLFPMNKKATNSTLSICYLLRKKFVC